MKVKDAIDSIPITIMEDHKRNDVILDSILRLLDSKGSYGASEENVLEYHMQLFGCPSDEIGVVIEQGVREHVIVKYVDDYEGNWLVGAEYAMAYNAIPWMNEGNECNTPFYSLLSGRVLSLLSWRPGSTLTSIHRELHLLSLDHTSLLLKKMQNDGMLASSIVKKRLNVSLFKNCNSGEDSEKVYFID